MYLCFFQPHNQLTMQATNTTELAKKLIDHILIDSLEQVTYQVPLLK